MVGLPAAVERAHQNAAFLKMDLVISPGDSFSCFRVEIAKGEPMVLGLAFARKHRQIRALAPALVEKMLATFDREITRASKGDISAFERDR